MKRCPECRRDYYDETLQYCLDDGAHLVEGPAGELPSESPTRVLPASDTKSATLASKRNSIIAGILGILIVTALGVGGYLYYNRGVAKPIDSIAVMPFVNESGNPDIDYLSDGMTDGLISSLSELPNLSVKARNSVFRYKGKDVNLPTVGKELSVQALVLGRVLQRGTNIALHIEIVDAQTENVLWSSDYNRPMANLVTLQGEISREVANSLRAKLTGDDQNRVTKSYPSNTEAYELYLKGRYFAGGKITEDGLKKGIEYYNLALEKDPNYALAYVGLARSYMSLGHVWGFQPPRETFPKAKVAISRALEIDNMLSEAHAASAAYNLSFEWNWAEAERQVRRAIELNPNDAAAHADYGTYLQAKRRFDDAVVERKLARDIEPLSPTATANVGYPLYYGGKYDEAIVHYQKALELDPNYAWSYLWIGQAYLEKGDHDEGLRYIQRAIEMSEGNIRMLATLGYAQAKIGNRKEAERIIGQLTDRAGETYISPYFVAVIYAGLNEKDLSFEWLEKAFQDRHPYLILMDAEPVFNNLRSDPRFEDLRGRVGLS
jgi:TolB-like protein/Tfp pilus assembly protein PilF